jgi:hygromycin-B 4-O-kinase
VTSRRPIDDARVLALLREQLGGAVAAPRRLAGGEFSRAFAFDLDGRGYVVRVSAFEHAEEAFAKDEYAGRHFASPALPIPAVVMRGRCEEGHFAISERVPGQRLGALSPELRSALLPATFDALDAVGRADVGGSRGYGGWDGGGNGRLATWRAFLTGVIENHADGFYRDWHRLFERSFLERDVFERIYRRMVELAADCPEERALIHNDLHFDNLLGDGERITGVIDWGNACYGDPLYDVAWVSWVYRKDAGIDAWTPLRERHGARPRFDERVGCYQLHVGLDDLRFFARTGRAEQYRSARDRLLGMVKR